MRRHHLLCGGQRQQGACMAHVQIAGHQHLLHRVGQIEQAQQVAGRTAAAAHGLRRLFVRELEIADQALQTLRFFQRVEVFALDVLDQRHHGCGFVGHFLHQHGHRGQAGQACGAVAAFAGDDLVVPRTDRSHEDGLHHPLAADALGQLVQGAFVHARARLVLAGAQLVQWQLGGLARAGGGCVADLGAEQRFQAHAQALGFLGDHGGIVHEDLRCHGE